MEKKCDLCAKVKDHSSSDFLGVIGEVLVFKGPFSSKWPGHVMLVYKGHHEEMSELPKSESFFLFEQMIRIEKFLLDVDGVRKVNLAKFGNVSAHLHWHVIPRYENEIYKEKSPWELIEVSNVHRNSIRPPEPYAAMKKALNL